MDKKRIKRIIRNFPKYSYNFIKLQLLFLRIVIFKIISKSSVDTNGWLILERGNDAQDNAWHFFKYMRENHPDINVKYAIDKTSRDYETNLSKYQDSVIEYDSFAYYKFLFNAEAVISTHLGTYTPKLNLSTKLDKSPFRFRGKLIFLQHGITQQRLKGLINPTRKPDLFISGATNEFKLLNDNFNYPRGVIKYTGFARFDNLIKCNPKRQILIMPTWRLKYVNLTMTQFEECEFFQTYKQLLTSRKLIQILKEYNYTLVFYNHYEFQKYNPLFEKFNSQHIKTVRFGEKRVQDLLKESTLLITDYSSIYYDFIYMKKPVIFFTFDKDDFEKNHYGQKYDHLEDFGLVESHSNTIINRIFDFITSGGQHNSRSLEKADEIFYYRDNKNCERIFGEIKSLCNKIKS